MVAVRLLRRTIAESRCRVGCGAPDHQSQYGYGLFSVILKASGKLTGDCGLEVMEVDGAQVACAWLRLPANNWHQGLATEAATAVRDFAFGAYLILDRALTEDCFAEDWCTQMLPFIDGGGKAVVCC